MSSREVDLVGVPVTMLWTLHNRASEAGRRDGKLHDPDCVRIYESIDFDYDRNFGTPDGTHAERSRIFDDALRPWLAEHPDGTVVELGAGLETQFQRCDNGRVRWLCVDVPDAVAVRERFLPASERCRHIACSALDPAWLDEVGSGEVFVTAQGLFMYFDEEQVRNLVTAMVDRLPGLQLMFDTIPPWFARKTMSGYSKTEHYTAPPMPWGVRRDDIAALLRGWSPRIREVHVRNYGPSRGPLAVTMPIFDRVPVLRNIPPTITRVRTTRA
ncbi:class I SAM-dependent methyltransferase [Nocardia wallacei]|uniref:class I SAM-dependent methyltransferase n=1 Tax=Nocardia wallacei TaxID=480035 RepID=UPI002455DFC4|nr:class I SAM-dependent methyltransferase [Nocardia wallacei]